MATTAYGTPYVTNTDLVSGWPGSSLLVAQRVDAVSYAGNGLNPQTGTSYGLVLTDAGKNVTLSNASAVTVTVPTFATQAYATGTVIYLTNLGAGTVTVAAAGTVTVNGSPLTLSQYTQGQLLNTAANTWVFTTGPIPTSPGLVQVIPTSISNTTGSSSLSGGAVTFTGVSQVNLNGVFTSTYDNYRIVLNGTASQNTGSLFLRLRVATVDASGATDYIYQVVEFSGSTVTAAGRTTSSFDMSYLNTTKMTGIADVLGPNLAQVTGYQLVGSRSNNLSLDGGYHNLTTQYDGFSLFTSAGTASGVVRVYGYKN